MPVTFALSYLFKVPFFWLVCGTFIAEDIPKTVLCLKHFYSRRWIRQITDIPTEALPPERE